MTKLREEVRIRDLKILTIAEQRRLRSRNRYPFAEMEVLDAVFIPDGIVRTTLSSAASTWGKQHGKRFAIRQYGPSDHVLVRLA